jgi:hypothetical protein
VSETLICPGFFILRIYVLWNNNKVILVAMLLTFVVSRSRCHSFHVNIISGCHCGIRGCPLFRHRGRAVYELLPCLSCDWSDSFLFHSCYQFHPGHYRLLPVIWKHRALCTFSTFLRSGIECVTEKWYIDALSFVFDTVLISLTLTCAIRTWRSNHGRVYAILLKHNVFYYACGLCKWERATGQSLLILSCS